MKKYLVSLLVLTAIVATASFAAFPTKSYTFVDGTVAVAAEVNGNFDNLYNGLSTGLNDANILTLQIGSVTVIDANQNLTNIDDIALNSLTAISNTIEVNDDVSLEANVIVNALTSGRVVYAGTNGLLQDDSDLTFATDTLTATKIVGSTSITDSSLTSGRVTFAGASGLLSDDADLTFSGTTLTATDIATDKIVGKAGFPVTIGDTDDDRLEITNADTNTASLQEYGTSSLYINQNAYRDNTSWHSYRSDRHSWIIQHAGTQNIAYILWNVAQPTAGTPSLTELMRLTEGGTLQAGSDDAQDLGAADMEWRNLYADGTAYLDAADVGTLVYSSAQTRYVVITPGAFQNYTNGKDWDIINGVTVQNDAGDFASNLYYADVQLPHGAIVTGLTLYWYLTDAAADTALKLGRMDTGASTTSYLATIAVTSQSGGYGNTTDSTISNGTIDNSGAYGYLLELEIDPNDSAIECLFKAAKITYTVTSPLP